MIYGMPLPWKWIQKSMFVKGYNLVVLFTLGVTPLIIPLKALRGGPATLSKENQFG
jgi:hypothetical protein